MSGPIPCLNRRYGLQLLEQLYHLVAAHAGAHIAAFEQSVGHILLCLVEGNDFLLDSVCCYDAVDGDRFLLPDALCAVAGLVLDGGVPPWVEVYDIVCCGKVESQSASFQAD